MTFGFRRSPSWRSGRTAVGLRNRERTIERLKLDLIERRFQILRERLVVEHVETVVGRRARWRARSSSGLGDRREIIRARAFRSVDHAEHERANAERSAVGRRVDDALDLVCVRIRIRFARRRVTVGQKDDGLGSVERARGLRGDGRSEGGRERRSPIKIVVRSRRRTLRCCSFEAGPS